MFNLLQCSCLREYRLVCSCSTGAATTLADASCAALAAEAAGADASCCSTVRSSGGG